MRRLMWFVAGFAVACFLCAYYVPRQLYLPAIVVGCLLLAAALGCMLRWKQARLPVAVFLGCVAALCWLQLQDLWLMAPVRACDGQTRTVSILVMDTPEPTKYGCKVPGRVTLDGKSYRVMLYLYKDDTAQLGDTVTGTFLLRSTLSDGSRDNRYFRGEGIFLMATSGKNLTITTPDNLPLRCYPAEARRQLTVLLNRLFPEETAGFAQALLLGDKSGLDYETDTALKVTGIAHVVAVSGMHVSMLYGLIYFLSRKRRLTVMLLGLPTLLFFAAMAGFTPSVTRACLMNGLMMTGLLFDRDYDPFTALAFAVLVMLGYNPYMILSVSFQLSVMCMMGIFLFSQPIRQWLMEEHRLGHLRCRRLWRSFASAVGIALGATIATAPLCALYFGMVSLMGLLSNILTLWIISYIFYGIMAACLLAGFFLPLGLVISRLTGMAIRLVLGIVKLLCRFPLAAVYVSSDYIRFWLAFCYCLLGAFVWMKKKRPFMLAALATIGLCMSLALSWLEPLQDPCRVTVLDVGQGQCVLLQSEGKSFLVDCGGSRDTAAADTAAAHLLSQGIARLDGIIVTHYDQDHAGGVPYLLTRVAADALYLPTTVEDGALTQTLMAEHGVQPVDSLTEIRFGKTKITLIPSEMADKDNESGLCVLFQREECDILITGDRSQAGERELLRTIELPQLEVLIVGHHGAKSSTGSELLAQTRPQIAIISVGENNFGHPAEQVLRRLEEYGCTIYRTDQNGTVVYRG